MHYDSIADLYRAIDGGAVGRGSIVYVSSELYGTMSYPQQTTLWERLLRVRARLVNDLPLLHGIEVMAAQEDGRSGGASGEAAEDDEVEVDDPPER